MISKGLQLGITVVALGALTGYGLAGAESRPGEEPRAPAPYYRYCSEARAAGVAPLHYGEPGYSPHLDRDNDGVACEPYRG